MPPTHGNSRLGRLSFTVIISSLGDPFTLTVSIVLLYGQYRAPLAIAAVYGSQMLGSLVLGSALSNATDRLDRRRLMVGLDVLRCLVVACLPLVTRASALWVYPGICIVGGIEVLVQPARQAAAAEMVGPERLGRAIALLILAMGLGQATGFAVAGALLSRLTDARLLYLPDAASFLVAAGLVTTLGPLGGGISTVKLTGGIRRAWAIHAARPLLLVSAPMSLVIGMLNPALVPFSYSISSDGPTAYTALEASLISGIVVGSLAATQIAARRRLAALSSSLWLFGGCIALIALAPSLREAAVPVGASGIGSAIYAATIGAALLQNSGDTARGTLMAVRFTLSQMTRVLGLGAGALSASLLGPHYTYLIMGVAILIVAAAYTAHLIRAGGQGEKRTDLSVM